MICLIGMCALMTSRTVIKPVPMTTAEKPTIIDPLLIPLGSMATAPDELKSTYKPDTYEICNWLEIELNKVLHDSGIDGGFSYCPEFCIDWSCAGPAQPTGATRLYKKVWEGMGVLRLRVWFHWTSGYRTMVTVLNAPTYRDVAIQLEHLIRSSGAVDGPKVDDGCGEIWITDIYNDRRQMPEFGRVPVYTACNGF